MKVRFTEETVKRLEAPEKGFRRYTDATEPFFGVRVTKAGAITFVLRYRNRYRRSAGLFHRYAPGIALSTAEQKPAMWRSKCWPLEGA